MGEKLLLNAGATLCEASIHDNVKRVKQLLDCNVDPDTTDNSGAIPLQVASMEGSTNVLQALIDAKAEVNAKVPIKLDTALHMAARIGSLEIVKILVEGGADTTIKNARGQ